MLNLKKGKKEKKRMQDAGLERSTTHLIQVHKNKRVVVLQIDAMAGTNRRCDTLDDGVPT